MDTISVEAMNGLSAVLAELLPAGAAPTLAPTLEVHPLRIVPTGLGGFVGLSHEPEGEIVGRRLEATALVAVKAASVDGLGEAVSAVTSALLAADRRSLRDRGVLRLDLDALGPKPAAASDGVAEREVQFKVLYEFLKRPVEAGDVIQRVPIDFELGRGKPTRTLVDTGLGVGSLAQFEVFDDPEATGKPSQWQENGAEERIEQLANVSSNVKIPENPKKEGTYLVLRTLPARPPVRDFVVRTTLRSGETGGIGLVFRWQDAGNFYFFLMHSDAERVYRVLGKKVGGTFAALDTPALDKTQGFEVGRLYDVKLVAEGPDFEVYLDGERILEGRDGSLAEPGRIGLLSRNNRQAFFYRVSAVQL
jgi:hypothetical protein